MTDSPDIVVFPALASTQRHHDEVRDFIAYLRTTAQVPLPKP